METFTEIKPLVNNPLFQHQRERALGSLDITKIDHPLIDLIDGFSRIQYCFTMQCCYGHFVHEYQKDENNIEPLSSLQSVKEIRYRIAYITFCIENSKQGKQLFHDLKTLTSIDPANVQFGCADWFWQRQVNSYALQVEPDRFKTQDESVIEIEEALLLEKIRKEFFDQLGRTINK
ncbi:MAG: hypothetical protein GY863_00990 [bacterium]|nr:hypothetical protein [bacterium]